MTGAHAPRKGGLCRKRKDHPGDGNPHPADHHRPVVHGRRRRQQRGEKIVGEHGVDRLPVLHDLGKSGLPLKEEDRADPRISQAAGDIGRLFQKIAPPGGGGSAEQPGPTHPGQPPPDLALENDHEDDDEAAEEIPDHPLEGDRNNFV